MGTVSMVRRMTKSAIRKALPLSLRKHMSIVINRQGWLRDTTRYWWTRELLRDFSEVDINGYHRFLWANHLGYALTYEVKARFGDEKLPGSRRVFFEDMRNHLDALGIHPDRVGSVFDVGCSLGYQLRHIETDIFRFATALEGVDIDRYAILQGSRHLLKSGSGIRLICDDIKQLDRVLENRTFDIMTCTGVLMYLEEDEAASVVEEMTRHCGVMIGVSGPAHPDFDNCRLGHSSTRDMDGSFIHNFDSMIERTGWKVFARRWEGSQEIDGHTVYFVFAVNPEFSI
jgi:SAM-dependent methyltransferase